jgi:hypothetical protein
MASGEHSQTLIPIHSRLSPIKTLLAKQRIYCEVETTKTKRGPTMTTVGGLVIHRTVLVTKRIVNWPLIRMMPLVIVRLRQWATTHPTLVSLPASSPYPPVKLAAAAAAATPPLPRGPYPHVAAPLPHPPHGVVAIPPFPLHLVMAPPLLHLVVAPPLLHLVVAPPPLHLVVAPPPLHLVAAPPPLHLVAAPPPLHLVAAPPPLHSVVATLPRHSAIALLEDARQGHHFPAVPAPL